jgi:hypothetical protein
LLIFGPFAFVFGLADQTAARRETHRFGLAPADFGLFCPNPSITAATAVELLIYWVSTFSHIVGQR